MNKKYVSNELLVTFFINGYKAEFANEVYLARTVLLTILKFNWSINLIWTDGAVPFTLMDFSLSWAIVCVFRVSAEVEHLPSMSLKVGSHFEHSVPDLYAWQPGIELTQFPSKLINGARQALNVSRSIAWEVATSTARTSAKILKSICMIQVTCVEQWKGAKCKIQVLLYE